ncbi:MAG: TPM domain-containing protein [Propionibacteriaceae bacterium]|nr:TPM domain-containing protein [Propionibacteriaceae bacterium]
MSAPRPGPTGQKPQKGQTGHADRDSLFDRSGTWKDKVTRAGWLIAALLAAWVIIGLFWALFPLKANAAPPLVVDEADLLTASEEASLEARAAALQSQYDFDVVIHTIDSPPGGQSAASANEQWYEQQGYSSYGMVLLVAIQSRDYDVYTTYSQRLVTNNERASIASSVAQWLSAGDYAGACDRYLDLATNALATSNTPGEAGFRSHPVLMSGAIGGGIGLIAAGITVGVWKRGLKTARPERDALAYQAKGSLHFTVKEDQFVSTHTAVIPLPRHEDGGRGFGGGGGGGGGFGGHSGGKF